MLGGLIIWPFSKTTTTGYQDLQNSSMYQVYIPFYAVGLKSDQKSAKCSDNSHTSIALVDTFCWKSKYHKGRNEPLFLLKVWPLVGSSCPSGQLHSISMQEALIRLSYTKYKIYKRSIRKFGKKMCSWGLRGAIGEVHGYIMIYNTYIWKLLKT